MTQTRLNAIAIFSIESEFLENFFYERLIDDFADKNAKKIIFFIVICTKSFPFSMI